MVVDRTGIEDTRDVKAPDREEAAFLTAARKLRRALTKRDQVIDHYRQRYDRYQNDLMVVREARVKIAGDLLRAALEADRAYTEYVSDALDEYRRRTSGNGESRF